ncbi:MAG: LacI family DNA-binding transcriptional regulator, partial [Cellulomonadaceae bacterium]
RGGAAPAGPPHASVAIDDAAEMERAVRHLRTLGHRRIAFIQCFDNEEPGSRTTTRRAEGYGRAVGEFYDPELQIEVPWTQGGGQQAMEVLSQLADPPTAIVGAWDELALGALAWLKDNHVSVPEQISVLGFDDQPVAAFAGLTTVAQPVQAQGDQAARITLRLLGGEALSTTTTVLPCRLIVRETTAPPPTP